TDAVLEALTLDLGRRRRVADLARADSEDVARVVERQKRPGGRLREVEHCAPRRQQVLQEQLAGARLRDAPHVRRELAQLVEQAALERSRIDDVEQRRGRFRGRVGVGAWLHHSDSSSADGRERAFRKREDGRVPGRFDLPRSAGGIKPGRIGSREGNGQRAPKKSASKNGARHAFPENSCLAPFSRKYVPGTNFRKLVPGTNFLEIGV